MRIAVIGTHCSGKTTLVEAFLAGAPEYGHEPEPYQTLSDDGVAFAATPVFDDLMQQFEFSIAALMRRAGERDVVFERSPLDLAAYLEVVGQRDGLEIAEELLDEAKEAVATLDLVVFLPLGDPDALAGLNPELPRLRARVDRQLKELVRSDLWDVFGEDGPKLVEIAGAPAVRLARLREAVAQHRD